MSKKLLALALILGVAGAVFAGGTTGWNQFGNEANTGWYWGYDNNPGTPPFNSPALPALPTWGNFDISANPGTSWLEDYADRPYQYTLEDSFWFYGNWYKPGKTLYFSPDGWISFDNSSTDGFPFPPPGDPPFPVTDDPNEIMAVLWQDMHPPRDVQLNQGYYRESTPTGTYMHFQWRNIQRDVPATEVYNFGIRLTMGGQRLLVQDACHVLFSRHFIEYGYNTCTGGSWTTGNPAIGIENLPGDRGINYPRANLANARV